MLRRAPGRALVAGAICAALLVPVAVAASPGELADRLEHNRGELREAIDAWHAEAGNPPGGQAPDGVMTRSRWLQKRMRFLARHPNFAKATVQGLSGGLRWEAKTLSGAQRKLFKLHGSKPPRLRVGKPKPLAELIRYYRKAKRRYGIGVKYLAAINLVETKFGRVKSRSSAGAIGPMQFIPSTWRIYGKGNIRDPHDAIMAAARLLRDNGAPGDYDRALYAYNPSRLYVAAVKRYARIITRDPYGLRFLYCWGP